MHEALTLPHPLVYYDHSVILLPLFCNNSGYTEKTLKSALVTFIHKTFSIKEFKLQESEFHYVSVLQPMLLAK